MYRDIRKFKAFIWLMAIMMMVSLTISIVINEFATFIVLTIILVISVLLSLLFYLYQPKETVGDYGETVVSKELHRIAALQHGYVIDDLYLQGVTKIDTSQIDHVYMDRTGIYVIETKNWTGVIIGDEFKSQWLQRKRKRDVTYHLSPLKQNEGHRNKLIDALDVDSSLVKSLIVFTDKANIKQVNSCQVTKIKDLEYRFANRRPIMSQETLNKLYWKLVDIRLTTTITKLEHVKNIQDKNAYYSLKVN